jgi:hypothetical protein
MTTSKAFDPTQDDESNLKAFSPMGLAELRELVSERSGPRISIYLPTLRGGQEVRQNPIRFKNAISAAASRLTDSWGLRGVDVDALLDRARALETNAAFWRRQSDGLAVFLAVDRFRAIRLPLSFEEETVVADRFHVKPLLPLFTEDERFHVLTVSPHRVNLFRATRHRIAPMQGDVPESFDEVLGGDWNQGSLQWHTRTGTHGATGARPAMFFGQGNKGDQQVQKKELAKFFAIVDSAVRREIPDPNTLLVLAGTEPAISLYREVNHHPALCADVVSGSADRLSADELRERAWEVVAPKLEVTRRDAVERFHASLGTGLATNDLAATLTATLEGRVRTLFVARDQRRPGRFDEERLTIALTDEPAGPDLLDEAAVRTLLQDGAVHAVPAADVPGDGVVAATFRF